MRKAIAAMLLGVALLGACASDGEGTGASDGSIEVMVENGEVSGDTDATVAVGTEVSITVSSEEDDRIHVHGYDLYADVSGGSGTVEFTADIPGVFEVELEQAHVQVVELTVE